MNSTPTYYTYDTLIYICWKNPKTEFYFNDLFSLMMLYQLIFNRLVLASSVCLFETEFCEGVFFTTYIH